MKNSGELFGELTIKRHMKNLLEAVAHMHSKGFVHRDLKPENIINVGDDLKLVDFGTVKNLR